MNPSRESTLGTIESELLESGNPPESQAQRGPVLQAEIARRFSVRVHESTVGKWLRQFGLTRFQARPCHPKTDFAAQEAFKKRLGSAARLWR